MEIERKFTLKSLPEDYEKYPFRHIEQAYLNTDPVVRVRKENDRYYLTYKAAEAFIPPDWFFEDVTFDPAYHNSTLSAMNLEKS